MTTVLVAILAGYFVLAWLADRRRATLARDRESAVGAGSRR